MDARVDVYQVLNLLNGNRYVGITTVGYRRRWRGHRGAAKRADTRLYRAMRHYGFDLFHVSLLKQCASLAEAKSEEIRLIALWKPAYNHSTGGESHAGCKMSLRERARRSARLRGIAPRPAGWKHTPETLAKMSAIQSARETEPRLGKMRPGSGLKGAETKRRHGTITRYWLGKKRDEETKRKISETKRSRPPRVWLPPEATLEIYRNNMRRAAAARRKPVICDNDGRKFESAKSASEFYGINRCGAAAVASGRKPHIRGLRFRYVGGG